MAYEKQTWQCGETITAEKLNHMEDGIAEALECCESGGDVGYECTEGYTTVYDGEVTTSGKDEYNPAFSDLYLPQFKNEQGLPATLRVTFNNTEYICPKYDPYGDGYEGRYGATHEYSEQESKDIWDWSMYPFQVVTDIYQDYVQVYTEDDGTYSVKLECFGEIIDTSECFDKAVNKVTAPLFVNVQQIYDVETDTYTGYRFDKTSEEIYEAQKNGRTVMVNHFGSEYCRLLYATHIGGCGGGAYKFAWVDFDDASSTFTHWLFDGIGADSYAEAVDLS